MASVPVLSLWRARAGHGGPSGDWSQAELAQFYRVAHALAQAGIAVETDRGLSDEHDPWFSFCRESDGEVVIHIARERGGYVLAGFAGGHVSRGRDFSELIERLLADHPAQGLDKRKQRNVVMHPATMLALLVSIAFLQSGESKAEAAAAAADKHEAPRAPFAGVLVGSRQLAASISSQLPLTATMEAAQAMTVLMVVSLVSQSAGPDAGADRGEPGAAPEFAGTSVSAQFAASHHLLDHDRPLGAEGMVDTAALAAPAHWTENHAGVEQLLELVAKLWTMPQEQAPAGFNIASAMAFFSIAKPDAEAAMQATKSAAVNADAVHSAAAQAKAAEGTTQAAPNAPATFFTILHTPGTAETAAQTVLKISFGGQDTLIAARSVGDSGKLYAIVSDIIAQAKGSMFSEAPSPGDAILHLTAGMTGPALPEWGALSPIHNPAPAATSEAPGTVKHLVLDDAGQRMVERAIAAFKEDVRDFAIAVSDKDIIFYSPDAVVNRTTELVVELWEFKDGSSISLVGVSHGGHLPYSL